VVGIAVRHFKTHGSLGNLAAVDADLAMACARAVKALDPSLLFIVMPGNELEKAGEKMGLRCVREVFADRAYDDDGNLVSRRLPGAMIHDPEIAVPRIVKLVEEGAIPTISGKKIKAAIDTICVHGDNPAAVEVARRIRNDLTAAGVTIRPMAETFA
jgi:UPF0271 protein